MPVKIACLSDTHGFLDERAIDFISACDEIWHAGDIGNIEVAVRLAQIGLLRAVHGNIDTMEIRSRFPLHQRFVCNGLDVWITHIGGYPGKYDRAVRPLIFESPPGLFICGHSHILKIIYDEKLGLLHINPGAAGRSGMHEMQTAVRFTVDDGKVSGLEILELKRNRSP